MSILTVREQNDQDPKIKKQSNQNISAKSEQNVAAESNLNIIEQFDQILAASNISIDTNNRGISI
ncbi:MAG: hypothetical protein EOP33_01100 [Rickettsiaceae bacterium]|nr:MAG: hypothetical protein EOP33_01100 [Rickettsiaceae bacterium]